MSQWKDEKRRGVVESSNLETESLRVTIHIHIYNPGKWHVSCHKLGVDSQPLEGIDLDAAKIEGLNLVRRKARKLYFEIREAMGLSDQDPND